VAGRKFTAAIAAGLAVAFVFGVYALFRLRFEAADAWPVYSTLRPDPLGAEALYESLAQQPGLNVSRNLRSLARLKGPDTALFFLGVTEWFVPSPDLERIAGAGGRVVIAFLPERPRLEAEVEIERQLRGNQRESKKHEQTFFEQIGVAPVVETVKKPPDSGWSDDPPRTTALWFDKLAPQWSVERQYRGHPVWIERPWKAGSIVLVADSWMLSNEALVQAPDAVALAKLVGPEHNIIFDEAHLGLEDSGSVAGLLRRYRLQGLIAALLVLAALYVWKNASPFLPRRPASADAAGLRGFSAASGLIGLLERSVKPARVIDLCVREYRQTATGRGMPYRLSDEHRRKLEEAMREGAVAADPVRGYESIRQAIEGTKYPWKQTSNN